MKGRVTKACLPSPDSVEEDANYVPGSSMTTKKHIQKPQNADTKLETKAKEKPKAHRSFQTKAENEFNTDNQPPDLSTAYVNRRYNTENDSYSVWNDVISSTGIYVK